MEVNSVKQKCFTKNLTCQSKSHNMIIKWKHLRTPYSSTLGDEKCLINLLAKNPPKSP